MYATCVHAQKPQAGPTLPSRVQCPDTPARWGKALVYSIYRFWRSKSSTIPSCKHEVPESGTGQGAQLHDQLSGASPALPCQGFPPRVTGPHPHHGVLSPQVAWPGIVPWEEGDRAPEPSYQPAPCLGQISHGHWVEKNRGAVRHKTPSGGAPSPDFCRLHPTPSRPFPALPTSPV